MQFFSSAIDTLQTLVVAIGAGLGVWSVANLLESQSMKQRLIRYNKSDERKSTIQTESVVRSRNIVK